MSGAVSRQTQAIIHADAILYNFNRVKSLSPDSGAVAVIKADAYGHGAVSVARILKEHADCFAVAIIEEALTLRDAGITKPIIILEGPHQARECALAKHQQCILVVHSFHQLAWLEASPPADRPVIWLKVDTGMHRLGFAPTDVAHVLKKYASLFTRDSVIMSHLAHADDPDCDFTKEQIARFDDVQALTDMTSSLANSPGTLAWPDARSHWNRIGIALYGGAPMASRRAVDDGLRPAMTLRAAVMAVRTVKAGESVGYGQTFIASRDTVLATVGIGYADGYPRHCPNGTPVAVNGQQATLAGRVSMDMITIDVTDIGPVKPGDPVELWGNTISIDDVAAAADTIAYELMTRVSARVPRIVRHV